MEYVIKSKNGLNIGKKTSSCECVDINLDEGEIFTLMGDQRQTAIENLSGVLWITQEDDITDYKFNQGERFTITHSGKVIIQGMPSARFRLFPVEQTNDEDMTKVLAHV
jgi:hypothetical protein